MTTHLVTAAAHISRLRFCKSEDQRGSHRAETAWAGCIPSWRSGGACSLLSQVAGKLSSLRLWNQGPRFLADVSWGPSPRPLTWGPSPHPQLLRPWRSVSAFPLVSLMAAGKCSPLGGTFLDPRVTPEVLCLSGSLWPRLKSEVHVPGTRRQSSLRDHGFAFSEVFIWFRCAGHWRDFL